MPATKTSPVWNTVYSCGRTQPHASASCDIGPRPATPIIPTLLPAAALWKGSSIPNRRYRTRSMSAGSRPQLAHRRAGDNTCFRKYLITRLRRGEDAQIGKAAIHPADRLKIRRKTLAADRPRTASSCLQPKFPGICLQGWRLRSQTTYSTKK